MAYGYILIIKDRNFRVCPKSQTLATSLLYLQGVLASWVVHARGCLHGRKTVYARKSSAETAER